MNYARHTFATMLKRAEVPTAFISEAMGHSNQKVTEYYFDSFRKDQQAKYITNLTPWDK